MDRVRYAIAMEGQAAWPQSSDGRLAGSDPGENFFGESVEDRFLEQDDAISDMSKLDALAQAGKWRQRIENKCTSAEMAVLRLYYSDDSKYIQLACVQLAKIIDIAERSEAWICSECWVFGRGGESNESVADIISNIFISARKNAEIAMT